jgi:hypothetical protein
MTTATNDLVVIEANGLIRVCCWCLSTARLAELHRLHRCTDGICQPCLDLIDREVA